MLHTPVGYATDRVNDWLVESADALERIAAALNGGTAIHPARIVREVADALMVEGLIAPGRDLTLVRLMFERADWTEIADRYLHPR